MVEIVDVNQGVLLPSLPKSDVPICVLIEDISLNERISLDLIFLLNDKGIVCEKDCTAAKYITETENFLLYFRKDKIEFGFPIVKEDWKEFNDFPDMKFKDDSFCFSNFEEDSVEPTIKTYEKLLFDLSINARNSYAKFKASSEYLTKSEFALNYRLIALKALVNSSKEYHLGISMTVKRLIKEIEDLNMDLIRKNANFTNKLNLITDLNLKQYFSEKKFGKFGANISLKFQNLELKMLDIEKSLKKFEDEVIENESSIQRLENNVLGTIEEIRCCEGLNQEPLFLENFQVCVSYSYFNEDLYKLTDQDYHPKTAIHEKLSDWKIGEQIESYRCKAECLDDWLMKLEEVEKRLNLAINSISTFYKRYINKAVEKVTRLKLSTSRKIDKYTARFESLKSRIKLLELPDILLSSNSQISAYLEDVKKNQTGEMALNLCNKILQSQEETREFISRYGNILPSEPFKDVIYSFYSQEKVAEGWKTSRESSSMSLSIGRGIPDSQYFLKQVNKQDIQNYYEEQLRLRKSSYEELCKKIETESNKLEQEIENKNDEVWEIMKQKKEIIDTLIDIHEEIEIISSPDPLSQAKSEFSLLLMKDEFYRKQKMMVIEEWREKNYKLASELRVTPDY